MITTLKSYYRWDLIAWAALILSGMALEVFGLVYHRDETFTGLVRTFVPLWLRAAVWGWLGYHFLIQVPK